MVQKIKIGNEILDCHGNLNLIKKYFSKGDHIQFWFCDEDNSYLHNGKIIDFGNLSVDYDVMITADNGREGNWDINIQSIKN